MSFLSVLNAIASAIQLGMRRWGKRLAVFALVWSIAWGWLTAPAALAGLNDDRFDGDIFALYAGNGSLVPPKVTLAEALKRDRPALLILYADDSRDCKQYSLIVSQLQAFYGRAADFLPIRIDSLPVKDHYAPTEAGYYFTGNLPQTVLFDAAGKVVLNEVGVLPFEQVDDVLREVFDLLPRSESVELKRRQVNEVTTELVKPTGKAPAAK